MITQHIPLGFHVGFLLAMWQYRGHIERIGPATLNASRVDSEIFIVTKNSTFCYQLLLLLLLLFQVLQQQNGNLITVQKENE